MGQFNLRDYVTLSENGGDPAVRASFQKTMSGNFDNANDAPFSPLELFVMELFRVISPNGGSISAIRMRGQKPMAHLWQRFGFPWNATATSAHPTRV
jgi:hypothetical protein